MKRRVEDHFKNQEYLLLLSEQWYVIEKKPG